jgi:hypothetical protein
MSCIDTGAELSCFPAEVLEASESFAKKVRFRQADGSTFERWTGSGVIFGADSYATDDHCRPFASRFEWLVFVRDERAVPTRGTTD